MWFAAAILVPCTALLYLGVRLLGQEGEITRQRAREVLQSRVENLRRDMQASLEPVRLAPGVPDGVAFHGKVRDGKVSLAWEVQPAVEQVRRALSDSIFQALLRGVSAEITVPPSGAAGDFLALQRAVSLERAGQTEAAAAFFARVAAKPAAVTDDYGVPLALYAIPRLPAGRLGPALAGAIESILATPHVLSPTGLRMAVSLAQEHGGGSAVARLKIPLENAKAAEQFQAAYASAGGASSLRWQSFGDPPFIVGFASTPAPGEFTFRAVRATDIASSSPIRPLFSLAEGQSLGEPFPGLRAVLPELNQDATPRQRPFVLGVLAIAFSMAFLGSLLWRRDFRREAQLSSLRTQFVAGVSHELRTPLTAIRMFIEALHDNPELDVATRQEYLTTMLRESERLSRLVENVLEFSRIERNRQTYQLRPVSLPSVIQSVLSSMQPLFEQSGVQLESAIAADLPSVQADPDALGQALANLLGNAMKFSGKVREIRVEARREGANVLIRVVDKGIGIPPREQQRIFDSFYRARVPENNSIQGAGLGLTLVRHVMRGHHGDVAVESQPGRGSTFTLMLPIPAGEQAP